MMSGSNNEVLMYAIVLGAIFFIFILPRIEKKYNQEEDEMKKQVVEKVSRTRTQKMTRKHRKISTILINLEKIADAIQEKKS